ncbi:IMP dehydrogenase, partial [Leucobacter chromiiresistens]
MEFIGATPTVDLTYSDVFLVPRRSEVRSRLDVALAPEDGTPATIPLVAANMNSVAGPRLAAVLARRGGLAVLPQDLSLDATAAAIRRVKVEPVAVDAPIVLPPEATAADALRLVPRAEGQLVVVADAAGPEAGAGAVPIGAVRGTLGALRL